MAARVITRRPPRIVPLADELAPTAADERVAITYDTPPAGVPTPLVPRDSADTLVVSTCGAPMDCSCCPPRGDR